MHHLQDFSEKSQELSVTTTQLRQPQRVVMMKALKAKKKKQALTLRAQRVLTSSHISLPKTHSPPGSSYQTFRQARSRLLVELKFFSLATQKEKFSQIHSLKDRRSTTFVLKSPASLTQRLFYQKESGKQPKTARLARLRQLKQRRGRTLFLAQRR